MKKETKNELTAFLMLASEILKTRDRRPVLNYVYSDDDNLVVTDGAILITLDKTKEDVAPGFYNIAKIGKELTLIPSNFEGKYPNYKMVIPEYTFIKALEIVFTKKEYMNNLIKLQDIARKYCGGYVSEAHFELLKKSEFIYQVFTPEKQYEEGHHYPLIFKGKELTIVAMPRWGE